MRILKKKFSKNLFIGLVVSIAFVLATYTVFIPALISNKYVISFSEKAVKKYTGLNVNIVNPKLVTGFSPVIKFDIDEFLLSDGQLPVINLSKFKTVVDIDEIFKQKIKILKFGAKYVFIDFNKLVKIFPAESSNNHSAKNSFDVDFYDSILYLKDGLFLYNLDEKTELKLIAKNMGVNNSNKSDRFVHFNLDADISKNNNNIHIAIYDDNKVIIGNKRLLIKDCPLILNHSKIFFNAFANKKDGFDLEIYAKRFFIPDIIKFLQTNVIENNINDVTALLKNINGDVDFNIKIYKDKINGNINVNRLSAEIKDLNNLPFHIYQGKIPLDEKNLKLENFKGFYANKKENEFEFSGTVEDYLSSIKTDITMIATLTNDFTKNYLSKVAGIKMELTGKNKAQILIDSINDKFNITMAGKIVKGDDILIEGASLSPVNYDRALKAILHVDGNNLNIETINYYIAKELTKQSKGIKPILTLNGDVNIPDGKILNLGFDIPRPLPSEFLNVLIGQKLFKNGTFYGNMEYINRHDIPKIKGNLIAEKILIPSQRLFLKEGSIKTNKELIKIIANGKYKRASYEFKGNILNQILFPIIIKNTSLSVDNIDVEKIMQSVTAPVQSEQDIKQAYANIEDTESENDGNTQTFDLSNLIIEDCIIKIIKGNYKEINFGNIEAKMSLNKDGIFKLKSNRFDIAEGISSADIDCDLKEQKYNLKLGIKDVDADIMSTAILNLKREIMGKASGIISINTDNSLKLNGFIKFVVQNGTIEKIGLVEYVLKFASLFRNPIAMLSPSIFSDLVNVPDGNFDKITGDLKLKDNKVELLKIKSYSDQLSAYIVGCYNLENSDSILRIYTKFSNKNKGFAGFLRNFSLNSLANRISLTSRNDTNYYEAELSQLPPINADEKDCQIFLTKVDGDVEHFNFISSLKKIK